MNEMLKEKAIWKFILLLAFLLTTSCILIIENSHYPVIIGTNFLILFIIILLLYIHYRSMELDLLKAIGQSSIAMALTDQKGQVRWVSDKMADLYGLSRSEIENKTIKTLPVKRTVSDVRLLIREAQNDGVAKSYGCVINPNSATQKITQTTLIPIKRTSITRNAYFLFVDNDITELRQKEKERIEGIRQANKQKGEIIKLFFHDLKSPLNVPFERAKSILHSNDDLDTTRLQVKQILKQLEGIKRWADSLSEWAKVKNDLITPFPRKFNLKQAVNEAIKYIEYAAEIEEVKINNSIPRRLYAKADPEMVESVCRNIISNSVKAISQRRQLYGFTKDLQGEIVISTKEIGNQVEVSIRDNGIGMAKKEKEKVFDKHKGLGSFVAKKFIQANNGSIWVENSDLNSGTNIIFTLPTTRQ